MSKKVGIVGYGAHIPRYRIKVEEIAKTWGADAPSYKKGLELTEKSVPPPDQDTITLSVEAAKRALKRAGIPGVKIGCMYIGSESHPYAVKPSGTVVAEAIGAVPFCRVADFEFACKAGTEGMFVAMTWSKPAKSSTEWVSRRTPRKAPRAMHLSIQLAQERPRS